MGDSWVQYVPVDAHWRPTPEAAEKAAAYLRSVVEVAEIGFEFKDEMTLYHPMENWDGVTCPACGADFEELWYQAVRRWGEERTKDVSLTMPCCGVATTLNELNYGATTAFGYFMLEVTNPRHEITAAQDAEVANLIGAPLLKVHVHL